MTDSAYDACPRGEGHPWTPPTLFPAFVVDSDELRTVLRNSDLLENWADGRADNLLRLLVASVHNANLSYAFEPDSDWKADARHELLRGSLAAWLTQDCLSRAFRVLLVRGVEEVPPGGVDVERRLLARFHGDLQEGLDQTKKLPQFFKKNPRPLLAEMLGRVNQVAQDAIAGVAVCDFRARDYLIQIAVLALLVRYQLGAGRFRRSKAQGDLLLSKMAARKAAHVEKLRRREDA